MNRFYSVMSWIFGAVFVLLGALTVFIVPFAGACFFAAACVLLPPIRKIFHSITKKQLSIIARGGAVLALSVTAMLMPGMELSGDSHEERKQKTEAEQLAKVRTNIEKAKQERQKRVEYFKANRAEAMAPILAARDAGLHQAVIDLASDYLGSGDAELLAINKAATDTLAAAAKAKKLADAREKKIQNQFGPTSGAHMKLQLIVQRAMNDPGSYQHVKSYYDDKGDHLVVELNFRGKNSFGALVLDSAKAKFTIDGELIEVIQ